MKIIIFAGGFGTRMWPASRKGHPKQFYPIVNGKSFFQITLSRFLKEFSIRDIFVSTEERYMKYVADQAPKLPRENIIAEPERRDMLAAVGLVSATIEHRFPGEVMFFSWSDHLIKREKLFLKKVKIAGEYSRISGAPVSLDEEPSFPTVHSGWLRRGKKVEKYRGSEIFEIRKQIEKPRLSLAKRLFRSGDYLIHTGYGAWRSDVMLGFYKQYAPRTHRILRKMMDSMGSAAEKRVVKANYSKIRKISIDFGLFEKIPSGVRLTIPMNVGWQDAGTWQLLYESLALGEDKTLLAGEVEYEEIGGHGNLVLGPKGKMIAVVGLSNIAVIDTEDGLLVSALDKTKDVKELFKILEKKNPKYVE